MSRLSVSRIAVILVLGGLFLSLAAAAGPPYAGRRLVEVLGELQQRGLTLVWSSAVVSNDMTVVEEPHSSDPRQVLDEILTPHGLRAQDDAGGAIVIVAVPRAPAVAIGTIRGVVTVRGDPELVRAVTVRVEDSELSSTVSADGSFAFPEVPVGVRALVAESALHQSQRVDGVRVREGKTARVIFELSPLSVFLEEVVVTPSHFKILDDEPESRQFLSRTEVEQMPHVADDLYRAVKRLPGAAGGDYSAAFHVRGGEQNELLVILDGVELYEPFHLKDFQNAFSIIDSAAIGGVDFLTGGYPAEYGDRMSGVMDISMATPSGSTTNSVAVGTLYSRLLSSGSFNGGADTWLVSARAWYPDLLPKLAGATTDKVLTDYYDLFAKVEHRFGSHSTLSGDVLAAFDDLGFETADEEETEGVAARYGSYHLWGNLQTSWSSRLYSQTVLAIGRLTRERDGLVENIVEGSLLIDDLRIFDFVDLRQDWNRDLSPRHLLKWGFHATVQEADYDYERIETVLDGGGSTTSEVLVALQPEGSSYGVYVADRFQPTGPVVVELGLRWDYQSWIGEHQVSPRLNLMYAVSPHTTFRAAWGRFHQSQRLNELQVEDGVTEFFPAQRAEHWLASVEHSFESGLGLRIEAYRKDLSELRPRYENQFSPLELFPEAREDRILVDPDLGLVRGVELLVKSDRARRVSWWLSYALASAEDEIDGEWQARSWDQRHALSFGLNLELPRRWNLNLAGVYRSGFPTTEATGVLVEDEQGELVPELVLGPRNGARYPPYHRIDARASKRLPSRRGELSLMIDVINLFNTRNVCCIDDFELVVDDDGSVTVIPQIQHWAPIIPSVAVRYQF